MSRRNNGGFTLLELLLAITIGSLVTLATISLMLLGVRINKVSTDTAIRQNTTRTVLSALEKVATEGSVTRLQSEPDSWVVYGEPQGTEAVLFAYDAEAMTIYAGDSTPILENVLASYVMLSETDVLTFFVETEDGIYSTAVYCRTAAEMEEPEHNEGEERIEEIQRQEGTDLPARMAFLKVLTSQYRLIGGGPNPGLVLDSDGHSTGIYYSQWYINNTQNTEWNADTPWCACFVSWALHEVADEHIRSIPEMGHRVHACPEWNACDNDPCYHHYHWFAAVDRFAEAMQAETENPANDFRWEKSMYYDGTYVPEPGDIMFVDWESDRDPDHVGVVLSLVDEWEDGVDAPSHVYTLEGNTAGIVAVRRYPIDSKLILAYGVIDWELTPEEQG